MRQSDEICLTGNNSTRQSTFTHETSFFSWTSVQKFYNLLPLGIASCKSIYEAKMYTVCNGLADGAAAAAKLTADGDNFVGHMDSPFSWWLHYTPISRN